ncbi:MAG TPA: hypothetical protein VM871_06965 [Flavisolibacter sp.]|jgi:hypothetical protein|nr:hypothetical protein [Flavisolibacter sp.]
MVTNNSLHYAIIRHIVDKGFAPSTETLATLLNSDTGTVEKGLYALQDYHGVVLQPHKPEVWVIHPFSLHPQIF